MSDEYDNREMLRWEAEQAAQLREDALESDRLLGERLDADTFGWFTTV